MPHKEAAVTLTYAADAALFKAFCDESRLQILELLRTGEKCACVLLSDLHISQPTLSHHMRILCRSRVVTSRRSGKRTHYSISPSGAQAAAATLSRLTTVTTSLDSEIACA